MSLPRRVAVDVNAVDETMRITWLVKGKVGERMEARHLMYVTDRCVKQPAHESKASF